MREFVFVIVCVCEISREKTRNVVPPTSNPSDAPVVACVSYLSLKA